MYDVNGNKEIFFFQMEPWGVPLRTALVQKMFLFTNLSHLRTKPIQDISYYAINFQILQLPSMLDTIKIFDRIEIDDVKAVAII